MLYDDAMLLSCVVLAFLATTTVEPPSLPAPLAWVEDQNDDPLVSRRLMLLEPGAEAARELLAPLLYSFDTSDNQVVAWLGERVLVNGLVQQTRPTPNVALSIHLVSVDDHTRQTVPDFHPHRLHASPDGRRVLCQDLGRLTLVTFTDVGPEIVPLLDRERHLGSSLVNRAWWNHDGSAALVSIQGRHGGLATGCWRVALPEDQTPDSPSPQPEHLGSVSGWPRQSFADGSILITERIERQKYTPHWSALHWPGTDRGAETLTDDLHWNQSIGTRPGSAPLAFAFTRFSDQALVLREDDERVLWTGVHPPDGICWSPDGDWLAFHARDEERKPWIHALHVPSGACWRIGAGLRPAWGPMAKKAPAIEVVGGVVVIPVAADADGALHPPALGFSAHLDGSTIHCARAEDRTQVRFLAFQRRGEHSAYGAYGLFGHKNPMSVPPPLEGDPIDWPDRDHLQALAYLLELAGVDSTHAASLSRDRQSIWFQEGLRLLLVVPLTDEDEIPELPATVKGDVALVIVELR